MMRCALHRSTKPALRLGASLFLIAGSWCAGQTTAVPPRPALPEFVVQAWHSEDGLPGNVVRAVAQAADGFLWVAAAEGVVRFDGVRFSGFPGAANDELSRVPANHLFPGRRSMWIAVQRGGLLRWTPGGFRRILRESEKPGVPIVTQVAEAEDESVLIVRGEEIWRWSPESPHAEPVSDPSPQMGLDLEKNLAGLVAAGHASAADRSRRLTDRAGRIWIADAAGGLKATLAEAGDSLTERVITEIPERVTDMMQDREGNLWVTTEANGLRRVRESRVSMLTTEDGLTDPVCLLAMQDSRRIWWVGGRNGDLARIENDRVSPVEFVTRAVTRPVSALFEDSTGRIWAATRDGTVFRWTGHIFEPFVEAGAGLSKVNAIAEDPRHGLWFAGFYGLSWWDGKSLHTPGAKDGVPEGEFTALAITADGTVWAGTRDGLVVRGGASGFRLLVLGNELGRRPVSCLRPAGPNEAWVSTLGAGLFHWDAKGWRHFGDEDGLPDGRLTWMVPAAGSEMWIGSMQGIIRVDTNRLLGSERPLSWLRLERADGLPTRECTGGAHPAGWRGADGELWFPTTQGVARIRPDQIHLESVPPPVLIESCRINGRNVPLESGQVEDGPGRCLIDLRFTALTYSAPEKVRFLVRLRGLDDRWQDPGGLRSASFASVPPGRYRFEVRAVNGDGVASAAPAALSILIRPHLWERPAFLVLLGSLVVLAATASGWAVARARMKRRLAVLRERQARETERARIARDLHDDLGADLTGIALMSDLAAEETPEAGKGPLREIAAKAREAVGALDEIVWAANPRHDSVASLVDYLSATSAERLSAAGIALRLDVPAHSDPVALAPESRHAVFLAVREALHNIVKHSGAREASLRIQQEQGWLEIAVTDKGRGFDLATVKEGDGLTNLHERMESCGGTCRLHSADGAGTQVVLRVPLLAVPRNPS